MELDKATILEALNLLNSRLAERKISGEICIFGGTAMVLAFSARVSTKDVDALFHPASEIREIAKDVGEELHLPSDWLNDGVKGFVSSAHQVTTQNMPQFSNLVVTMPVPEYLLAMKCMAARIAHSPNEPDDVKDIKFLIKYLKLRSPQEVFEKVENYYAADQISVKTKYLIEGLFDEKRST